jgi:hypothetical protein
MPKNCCRRRRRRRRRHAHKQFRAAIVKRMSYAVKEERHEPIIRDHQLPLSPVAEAGPDVKENVKEVLSSSHTVSKDLCNGTVQIIRAQVQKQSPKRSNSQT